LLTIMATGEYQGKTVDHPEIRALFSLENVETSEWYQDRLKAKQQQTIALWKKHQAYLHAFLQQKSHEDISHELDIGSKLQLTEDTLKEVCSVDFLESLRGSIGADPANLNFI